MDTLKLGLKENWKQFTLLVIVNAFVGGMVGLERSILPDIATQEFGVVAKSAIFSFIIIFGISKAITNYYTGRLANRFGRKKLLIIGWVFAIPVPLILMYADSWNYVLLANVLLGINQGLAWSSTVVMKIDLVGQKDRGFAMGLNEFSGYLSVAIIAFLTSWVATNYGLRPYPFYIGLALVALGLICSVFFVKETKGFIATEIQETIQQPKLKNVFMDTTWRHKYLGSVTFAGLVNNLNDGMMWGVFPLLLAQKGFSLANTGLIVAVYPAVWGIGQLFTGKMADRYDKKKLLFFGMLLQAIVLLSLLYTDTLPLYIFLSGVLGFGTALVYPTFLVAIADNTNPEDRAGAIGVFRLWRDLGYAIGAILTGVLFDAYSLEVSILFVGVLTLISALVIQFRVPKKV